MPRQTETVSRIYIKVGGQEVESKTMNKVLEVVVDQSLFLPSMFTILLADEGLKLLGGDPFDLAKEVVIEAADLEGEKSTLIKGEITALEPEFREGMIAHLLVRGYDKSHRLHREKKSRTFANIKDSDLASKIAGEVGLSAQADATSAVYDLVYQHNQTDMEFLHERASRIGFQAFADDGKLFFRTTPTSPPSTELTWGQDLITFTPVMSLARQVDEVNVQGWDPEKKEAIVGKATKGKLYAKVGESKNGASWASTFGTGKKVIVDVPVVSQAEADTLAGAHLDEISGDFINAEGRAFRRPDLKAGMDVDLKGLGDRFSGKYHMTSITHVYNAEGFESLFSVTGLHSGQLSETLGHRADIERWPGIVPAIVTNTDDPKDWGRIKVKYPWMTDDAESDWARVISPGAGPEAGFYLIPEVEDEVMVAFEQGDFDHPYILGGVWNGKHKIPPPGAGASLGEKPLVRSWHSIKGHQITMYDNGDNKIEITTAGGHTVTLDDAEKKIEIKSSGGATITMDDNTKKVSLGSGGDVETKSTANTTIKGVNVKIEASGKIDLTASGPVTIKGSMINLN